MEEILGSHIDDHVFDSFLNQWTNVIDARIERATALIGAIDGVEGLLLAGSNGVGRAWPLSDIDFIPIYADDKRETAIRSVEDVRLRLLAEWSTQGWRTGVDVGRLFFTMQELESVFEVDDPNPDSLLENERWYYSMDKAFRSRVLLDPNGSVGRLSAWFTAHRFDPFVVDLRLQRSMAESQASLGLMASKLEENDRATAWGMLIKSVQWYQVHLMERWLERDNSYGRFGTRFEQVAVRFGETGTVDFLNEITSLTPELVQSRLERAPAWVHERRDRSWKARRYIGEPVTELQNDRDVLRVSTIYELRLVDTPPFDAWLAVPSESDLRERALKITALLQA